MIKIFIIVCFFILAKCYGVANMNTETKISKSDDEWKELLSEEEYYVTRLKGTERPFSGKYNNFKKIGIYSCVCCNQDLFYLIQNLIPDADGQVTLRLLMKR